MSQSGIKKGTALPVTQKQTVSTFHAKTKDCVKLVKAQLDKIPRAQKSVPQIPITRRSGIKNENQPRADGDGRRVRLCSANMSNT